MKALDIEIAKVGKYWDFIILDQDEKLRFVDDDRYTDGIVHYDCDGVQIISWHCPELRILNEHNIKIFIRGKDK